MHFRQYIYVFVTPACTFSFLNLINEFIIVETLWCSSLSDYTKFYIPVKANSQIYYMNPPLVHGQCL